MFQKLADILYTTGFVNPSIIKDILNCDKVENVSFKSTAGDHSDCGLGRQAAESITNEIKTLTFKMRETDKKQTRDQFKNRQREADLWLVKFTALKVCNNLKVLPQNTRRTFKQRVKQAMYMYTL